MIDKWFQLKEVIFQGKRKEHQRLMKNFLVKGGEDNLYVVPGKLPD